jgi:uncharacterized membrane protein
MGFKSRLIQENKKGIVLMIFASAFTATGQLLWKISEGQLSWALITGLVLYGLGAITMIYAFKFGNLSMLHPLLSLSYVFAIFLGQFFLNESLSFVNYMGVLLILLGSVLLGGGDQ